MENLAPLTSYFILHTPYALRGMKSDYIWPNIAGRNAQFFEKCLVVECGYGSYDRDANFDDVFVYIQFGAELHH